MSHKINIDKEWLYEKYVVERLSTTEISYFFNCHRTVIINRLKLYNIIARTNSEAHKENHKNHCKDCGKLLARNNKAYAAKRCKKCNIKYRYQNNKNLKYHCLDCNKIISKKQAIRCKECANKGQNNPAYIHGLAYEPYSIEFNKKLKLNIKLRDDNRCQICGRNFNLCVHHIDYNKHNCSKNNLITLCKQCHTKTNFNRKYWINYFKGIKIDIIEYVSS